MIKLSCVVAFDEGNNSNQKNQTGEDRKDDWPGPGAEPNFVIRDKKQEKRQQRDKVSALYSPDIKLSDVSPVEIESQENSRVAGDKY